MASAARQHQESPAGHHGARGGGQSAGPLAGWLVFNSPSALPAPGLVAFVSGSAIAYLKSTIAPCEARSTGSAFDPARHGGRRRRGRPAPSPPPRVPGTGGWCWHAYRWVSFSSSSSFWPRRVVGPRARREREREGPPRGPSTCPPPSPPCRPPPPSPPPRGVVDVVDAALPRAPALPRLPWRADGGSAPDIVPSNAGMVAPRAHALPVWNKAESPPSVRSPPRSVRTRFPLPRLRARAFPSARRRRHGPSERAALRSARARRAPKTRARKHESSRLGSSRRECA